jgi:hypothetical protein
MIATVVLGLGSLALFAGCGGSDGDGGDTSTITTEATIATTTTVPTTVTTSTTVPTTVTTAGGGVTTSSPANTLPALIPGRPCTPGSDPDCVDPDGTGQYVYLIGGAQCMAGPLAGPLCSDLDGDGRAGYPDSG